MMELKTISANGQELAYYECGQGSLVICLHGFPDTADTWADLLPALAERGFRAVAPFLRGYPPSGLASDGDYHIVSVARDVLSLIGALGVERASLVGHDWGAFAAYTAANLAPQSIEKMITLAIPHLRALRPTPQLFWRTRHFVAFQLPGAADRLRKNNFAAIDALYRRWSPNWKFSENDLAPVKRCFAQNGAVEAALGYYRAYVRDALKPAVQRLVREKTLVPTLSVFGDRDGALAASDFKNAAAAFIARYEELPVAGAGHFVHREAPEKFIAATLKFLTS